ncbi:hypothetical protein HC024_00290 [Methylococcaceae bacterium WWC4]|nr:hypothetical protein [Methylococcaceae bacterium WWC4]
MTDAELPIQYLPESLRRIAEYCGWDVMWAVWEHYAGCRVAVPAKLDAAGELPQVLGAHMAAKLISAFAGELLFIAKADAAKRAVRDIAIRHDAAQGAKMDELVRRYKLTYRQIQTITRLDRQPPVNNLDIFGF